MVHILVVVSVGDWVDMLAVVKGFHLVDWLVVV